MRVSLVPPGSQSPSSRFTLTASPSTEVLAHRSRVGEQIVVGIDLAAPGQWQSVSIAQVDGVDAPLLRALIGNRAVGHVSRFVRASGEDCAPADGGTVVVDLGAAAPWTRIAVVDGLDRWLQVPLDQALVDAERGVTRGWAARSLPDDSKVRERILGEALHLARAASTGVSRYLRALGRRGEPIPAGLYRAVAGLMDGYDYLASQVSGADGELKAVLDTWHTASTRSSTASGRRVSTPDASRSPASRRSRRGSGRGLTSKIDPRQVRSRVFALSTDPASAEVTMRDTQLGEQTAVLVRVPAFRRLTDMRTIPHLSVRLVDPLTADARGESPLTVTAPEGRPRRSYFEGIVPVEGASAGPLRADVFDPLEELPPVPADTDEQLGEVRRATVFLSEWRQLIASARLPASDLEPARRLRELAERLQPEPRNAERPLFTGGPTPADLERLADEGDDRFVDRARATGSGEASGPADTGLFSLVAGLGDLLVAELAASLE